MATQQQQTSKIRDEVRQTIRQLSELCQTVSDFDQFCEEVLAEVVRITGAHGALLWQTGGGPVPRLTHHSGEAPHQTAADVLAPGHELHMHALTGVIENQRPIGISSDNMVDNNIEKLPAVDAFLMLLAPVNDRSGQCTGVVELVQRGDVAKTAQDGYLRFLSQIAQLFQRWNEYQDLNRLSVSAEKWDKQVDFIREVHGTIDFKETAYSIANEARRLLNADRVSVAKWTGRRCKILAISSQDRFDNRANVVKKLQRIATSSVKADTEFWITGDTEGLAPNIATKINDYLDESNSRTLGVIPLVKRPSDLPTLEMKKSKREKPVKLGGLIVEFFDADVPKTQVAEDCGLVVAQSQLALNNARRHNEIFLAPVWKRLGWLQKLLFQDFFARTMTGLAALTILVLTLIFLPWELKMRVDGVMHPKIRQHVYAQTPGVIEKILVEENSEVKKDQLLLQLSNVDLEVQISQTESQLDTLQAQLEQANFAVSRRRDNEQATEASVQVELLEKQLDAKLEFLDLLKKKEAALRVLAPIDGVVVTRDPQRRLADLPVNPSQLLLSINRLDGDWELEIKIPQHKIAYVDYALERERNADGEELKVVFTTATDPNYQLEGHLVRVSDRTFPDEQGVPHYRGIVRVDDMAQLKKPRPGAGVTAKIYCGKEPLGFIWFYQPWDYIRTNILF